MVLGLRLISPLGASAGCLGRLSDVPRVRGWRKKKRRDQAGQVTRAWKHASDWTPLDENGRSKRTGSWLNGTSSRTCQATANDSIFYMEPAISDSGRSKKKKNKRDQKKESNRQKNQQPGPRRKCSSHSPRPSTKHLSVTANYRTCNCPPWPRFCVTALACHFAITTFLLSTPSTLALDSSQTEPVAAYQTYGGRQQENGRQRQEEGVSPPRAPSRPPRCRASPV